MSSRNRKRSSIKELESYLQGLDDFEQPKVNLEQYATPPHIAAQMLNIIDSTFDDLQGNIVADLGCGTGRLTVGSLICDAAYVVGFDIDPDALKIGLENIKDVFVADNADQELPYKSCDNFNFVLVNIASDKGLDYWKEMESKYDTVIMNPPFGTKNNQGLDMKFLEVALQISSGQVYSLHKTSTRQHIQNRCKQWELEGNPIAQIRYNLDSTYKFHRKKSMDIDVDLWRIST